MMTLAYLTAMLLLNRITKRSMEIVRNSSVLTSQVNQKVLQVARI